jgi:L-amino acid N-acyltransferase YncA
METQIRLAERRDSEQIAHIYGLYVLTTAISFEIDPPGADEMRTRVEKTMEFMPWLVCERAGRILGYAYADKYRTRAAYQWSASVSIYVDSAVHRRGVGRGLYTSLFSILKLQGLHNLYAGITLPDVGGSVGFHESFGFKQISLEESVGFKFGSWHHVGIWHLLLSPLVLDPRPPISVREAARTVAWNAALTAGLSLVR